MIGKTFSRRRRGGETKKAKTKKAKTKKRVIHCQDAIPWLEKQRGLDAIVTFIPEMDEMDRCPSIGQGQANAMR